jgi:hypothetical protein
MGTGNNADTKNKVGIGALREPRDFDHRIKWGDLFPPVAAPLRPVDVDGVDRSNTASLLIFDNSVGGNARVTNNTGLVDVIGNHVGGSLRCANNPMLVTGGGNIATTKQG